MNPIVLAVAGLTVLGLVGSIILEKDKTVLFG